VFAHTLKQWIERAFSDQVSVFVSSDLVSIQAGDEWYDKIMEALGAANLFIVICSPLSLERPWANFETGVAAFRGVRIVPICHQGMVPAKLPQPLHRFQGIDISRPSMPTQLSVPIAKMLDVTLPAIPEADFLSELQKASDQSRGREQGGGDAPQSAPKMAAPSAVSRAREIALQARFDEETMRLLQNGNSAFHDAATKLIEELELRLQVIAQDTSWDIKRGGDSHSEYVCFAQGYTFQLLPKNVYINTAHNASIRVRFFKGRLLSLIERQTYIALEGANGVIEGLRIESHPNSEVRLELESRGHRTLERECGRANHY
jgi:TIR domain